MDVASFALADRQTIGLLAGLILAVRTVRYIVTILRGRTRPSRASWWIWTALGVIALLEYRETGETAAMWVPIMAALGPLAVALVSIRHGDTTSPRLEWVVALGAALSLAVWGVTGSPALGLAACIIADAIGALPTLKKGYWHPDGEDLTAWCMSAVAYTLNLFAIECWTPFHASFPVYLALFALTVVGAILLGRRRARRA